MDYEDKESVKKILTDLMGIVDRINREDSKFRLASIELVVDTFNAIESIESFPYREDLHRILGTYLTEIYTDINKDLTELKLVSMSVQ